MILLLLSLVPLLLGPVLVQVLLRFPRLVPMLDGFVLVSVGGIVFVHILPESVARGGGLAAGAAVVGLLLPFLFERTAKTDGSSRISGIILLAAIGLAIHGTLDGVGLAAGDLHAEHGLVLALGVVIHRLPAGLAIWWLARGRLGIKGAIFFVSTLVVFSCVGFGISNVWPGVFEGSFWYVIQALLVGLLVHVLTHRALGEAHAEKGLQLASALGAALGVALLVALGRFEHHADEVVTAALSLPETFRVLALQSASPILLGFALAGLMRSFTPDGVYRWIGSGGALTRALKGAAVGFPLNTCSCSVLPIYRTLIADNISTRGALAFLVSAPGIGVTTILISLGLLGWQMSLFRILAAFALGIGVSLLTGHVQRRSPHQPAPQEASGAGSRLKKGLRYGFVELLDHTLPWIVVGVGVAAVAEPMIAPGQLARIPAWVQVPGAALIGIPLYVCATGSTPLVALLFHKGLSAGAGLAFLLSGPATNIATFGTLTELHGKRLALLSAAGIAAASTGLGYLFDLFGGVQAALPIHDMARQGHGPVGWGSLVLLGALLVSSVLRQGTRGFADQILRLHRHDHHAEHDR